MKSRIPPTALLRIFRFLLASSGLLLCWTDSSVNLCDSLLHGNLYQFFWGFLILGHDSWNGVAVFGVTVEFMLCFFRRASRIDAVLNYQASTLSLMLHIWKLAWHEIFVWKHDLEQNESCMQWDGCVRFQYLSTDTSTIESDVKWNFLDVDPGFNLQDMSDWNVLTHPVAFM